MSQEIHVGDVGTVFELTVTDAGVPVDVSSASVKQILFSKPGGVVVTKTAELVSDGSDGKIKYTTLAGDLDASGVWKLQVYIELPSGHWKSDVQNFKVYPNLA